MKATRVSGDVGAASPSIGHLSVRVDGAHPDEETFLFEQQRKRIGPAALASLASHVAMFLVAFLLVRVGTPAANTIVPSLHASSSIIWLTQPGPGGGGGGGGNQMQEPPRKAELPGKDKITVPVVKAPTVEVTKREPNPVEQLNIPAKSLADATDLLAGALEAPPGPPTASLGSGTGGGAGTGRGTGIGPGAGSGLGPGTGGGTGGGAYQPGNGVSMPRLLREVRPNYTTDAMRAKVQGTVLLECIVNAKGEVTDVKILRSLDATFGLDQEAIKAAKQWRFAPGTRLGEPSRWSCPWVQVRYGECPHSRRPD